MSSPRVVGWANGVRLLAVGVGALSLALAVASWAALEDDIQAAATAYEVCVKAAKKKFNQTTGNGVMGNTDKDNIINGCSTEMDALSALLPERYQTTVPDEIETAARNYLEE